MWMSPNSYVHVCVCLLFAQKQSGWNFWGKIYYMKYIWGYVQLIYIYIYIRCFTIHGISFKLQENQKDLETATETLSEYLERDISAENLVDIKQKVQDKYR